MKMTRTTISIIDQWINKEGLGRKWDGAGVTFAKDTKLICDSERESLREIFVLLPTSLCVFTKDFAHARPEDSVNQ